jgi:hypothetical protein
MRGACGWRRRVVVALAVSTAALACGANRRAAVAPRPAPSPVTAMPTPVPTPVPVSVSVSVSVSESVSEPRSSPTPAPTDDAWKSAFETTIRPLLAQRCTPCHQRGGIMYARLPFDDARTVADAARDRPGFLRRLKGADHEAVEAWVATLPPR